VCVCVFSRDQIRGDERSEEIEFCGNFGRFVSALPFTACSVFHCLYEEFVEILFSLIAAFSDLLYVNDLCWIAWIVGAGRVAF
jgi:hypothetical protein